MLMQQQSLLTRFCLFSLGKLAYVEYNLFPPVHNKLFVGSRMQFPSSSSTFDISVAANAFQIFVKTCVAQ